MPIHHYIHNTIMYFRRQSHCIISTTRQLHEYNNTACSTVQVTNECLGDKSTARPSINPCVKMP